MPSFDGSSYLRHPGLGETGLIWLELEVIFKLTSEDGEEEGLLLYNGDRSDGQGDFMAVYLHRGYLEFAFDVGNGIAIARLAQNLEISYLTCGV
jgi:pikachurin